MAACFERGEKPEKIGIEKIIYNTNFNFFVQGKDFTLWRLSFPWKREILYSYLSNRKSKFSLSKENHFIFLSFCFYCSPKKMYCTTKKKNRIMDWTKNWNNFFLRNKIILSHKQKTNFLCRGIISLHKRTPRSFLVASLETTLTQWTSTHAFLVVSAVNEGHHTP